MLIKKFMTQNPVILSPEEDVQVAFNLLTIKEVRQAPVLDNGKLIGIVTDRDLRMAIVQDLNDTNLTVRNFMTSNPKTVFEDAPLQSAANIIAEKKFNALPVISESGNLVGIITTTDILLGLLNTVEN